MNSALMCYIQLGKDSSCVSLYKGEAKIVAAGHHACCACLTGALPIGAPSRLAC